MALLDQEIPAGSDVVTLELLQRCIGHYCIVKYDPKECETPPEAEEARESELCERVTAVGLVSSLHVVSAVGGKSVSEEITLLRGLTEFDIEGSDIEYIYAIDLPLAADPDLVADLLGFRGV